MLRGERAVLGGKRQQLMDMRRQRILEAAMDIFSRDGFHRADVEEIAAQAGVGKGTVYRHFGNKEDLFLAVVEWGLDTLYQRIDEAIDPLSDPLEKLETFLTYYTSFFARNRNFYRVLVQEVERIHRERGRVQSKWGAFLGWLSAVVREGIEKGVIKPLDPMSLAVALAGMTNFLLHKWLISEEEYPLERELAVIRELFFKGAIQRGEDL